MNRLWILLLALVLASCVAPEERDAACFGSGDDCEASIGEAMLPITGSVATSAVLAISDNGGNWLPGGWRDNGIVYNNTSPRCVALKGVYSYNEYALAKFVPFSCPAGETAQEVTLTFSTTEWSTGTLARIREVLQQWDAPPAPCPNGCTASTHVGFRYRQAGIPWAILGANGIGTDVSSEFVQFSLSSGEGIKARSLNVSDLLLDCVQAGGACSLRFESHDPALHYWLASAGMALSVACVPGGPPPPVCGDGAIAAPETCDDGLPPAAGDGCSAACTVETGWTCSGAPSACSTACGDGVKAGPEGCDDGNLVSHDGCSAACVAEVCNWQ